MIRLPKWTNILAEDDEEDLESLLSEDVEPPRTMEDTVIGFMYESEVHETLKEDSFVSAAVLQANETGALVRLRRGTEDFEIHGPYKRTRRISAVGFDPILSHLEFETERARLLDWARRNAPRRRQRTMSNPSAMLARVIEGLPRDYGSIGETTGDREGGMRHVRSRTMM